MRVAFLGNAPWSVPSLESIAGSAHDISIVLTRAPRPAGRGSALVRTPVAESAERLGLETKEIETVKAGEGFAALEKARPDVLAVVAYGEILPAPVLEVPAIAPVNLHFSLLPELRGAAPVQRAIMNGASRTGVTTIRMDQGMDTGPILLQAGAAIGEREDAGELGTRLARLGGGVLVETLDALEAGSLVERQQDHDRATYAPKLTPEDRVIDWSGSAEKIARQVRALAPEPGAQTMFRRKVLKVFKASVEAPGADDERIAGSVAEASKSGFSVAAAGGLVRLEEVALEGRKRMTGVEFVRGHRPELGENLGST
ncbi:MAG TPA: methionyl-tRNA formyltransferase [Actinomycetota bacterium]|jgi:methionyl-tRNA formyltransferase